MPQRLILMFSLLCTVSLSVFPQSFTGKVVSLDGGKPVKAATVLLIGTGGKTILKSSRTDGKGHFSVAVPEGKTAERLIFSCVGYDRDTVFIRNFRNGQTVRLAEKAVNIKEVTVKVERIRTAGDTLDYLVGSFKQKQDRSIADVIKKMPGLQVNGDGTIEYQGRRINKFYIEGSDLLGNKYSQASENIAADKVKKVQVLQNHQPVKMLRDITFSQQAALNIVLKDEAKNVWQEVFDVGSGSALQGGAEWLRDMKLTAMMFSGKMQSISMYKNNNTGKDIMKEVEDKAMFENGAPVESGLLDNISIASPNLDANRSTFNDSHSFATNWLFKTSKDNNLRLQLSGLSDKTVMNAETETYYTNIADGTVITEDVDADRRRGELSGELLYEVNNSRMLFTNKLKGYIDFNRGRGTSWLNGKKVRENVKPRKRYVSDKFEISRRLSKGKLLSLNGYFSYNNLPGSLLLSDDTRQTLDLQSMYWGAETYFGHRLGRIDIRYTLDTKGKTQRLETENSGYAGTDTYTENITRLTPSARYRKGIFDVSLKVPLAWMARSFRGENRSDYFAAPDLSLVLTPDAYWNISMSYAFNRSPSDLASITDAPVFTSYINMTQGTGTFNDTRNHNVNVSFDYKNAVKGLFLWLTASLTENKDNILYESSVVDGVYRSKATDRRSDSRGLSLMGRVTKSFRWAKLSTGLWAFYTRNDYDMLLADETTPFRMHNLRLMYTLSMQPASWFSFEENSSYSIIKQENRADRSLDVPSVSSFTHYLKLFFMPGSWQIEWSNEVYHSSDKSVSFNYFADLSVSYRRKTYELGLSLNNIFGNKRYERRVISDSYRMYNVNRLRPREILARVAFSL